MKGFGTILIVDDNLMLLNAIKRVLETEGYEVVKASSALEALSVLVDPSLQVSLMLTDMVMPQTTGLELAAKARDVIPNLKILITSGYTAEFFPELIAAGYRLIEKPFRAETLLAEVRKALQAT